MYLKKHHIHLVGIGGIGMSSLARLLVNLGYTISGSDIITSNTIKKLQLTGIKIFIGHKKNNIKNAKLIVTSSAIDCNNIEIKSAYKTKIPIISRARMLAELIKNKYNIAISGTHGKTSTTSLISSILKENKLDLTVMVGGNSRNINSNNIIEKDKFIITEIDESDSSFLEFSPNIAVITNIDNDHLDFYNNINSIKRVFLTFINNIPFYGTIILCIDDQSIYDLLPKFKKKYLTYSIYRKSDLKAANILSNNMKSQFNVIHLGVNKGKIFINSSGEHNIYNALAAIATGIKLKIPFNIIKKALKTSKKIQRRMEIKGITDKIIVIDDYAHHPTEIMKTLNTINQNWPHKRKIVVFQPHRYSRTEALFNEFVHSFNQSNILIILPIYSASETSTNTTKKSKDLFNAIKNSGHSKVLHAKTFNIAIEYLKIILKKEDILITLGAGNINNISEKILKIINQSC